MNRTSRTPFVTLVGVPSRAVDTSAPDRADGEVGVVLYPVLDRRSETAKAEVFGSTATDLTSAPGRATHEVVIRDLATDALVKVSQEVQRPYRSRHATSTTVADRAADVFVRDRRER